MEIITIISIILASFVCMIFIADAIRSIVDVVRMDNNTLKTEGVNELLGTMVEVFGILLVVSSITTMF